MNAIGGTSSKDVWGFEPPASVWHYDGVSWATVVGTTVGDTPPIAAIAPDDVWLLGYGIVHYDGKTWTTVSARGFAVALPRADGTVTPMVGRAEPRRFRRGASIGLLAAALACGGRASSTGGADGGGTVSGDDGGSNGGGTSGGASSGVSSSGATSSSGSPGSSGVGSSGGYASSSSSSGSAYARSCGSGVDCSPQYNPGAPPGLVCCITSMLITTVCQPPPCPSSTPIGPVQVCASSAECAQGEVCGPLTVAGQIMIARCAPLDAGSPPPCGPQTCGGGCCDSTAMCRAGGYDQFCGNGGVACTDCTAAGGICANRACSGSVDASAAE